MGPGSVALALLQPAGPVALWSGKGFVDWVRSAMFTRYEDVYFRPVVQAGSIAALRWRVAKLTWPLAAEGRAFALGMLALAPPRRRDPEEIEEAYAFYQQRLATSGFSEETVANIDYALYTTMRLANGLDARNFDTSVDFSWQTFSKLLVSANHYQLYMGALLIATCEPGVVRNPLVLREIARSTTKAGDAMILAATALGFSIV